MGKITKESFKYFKGIYELPCGWTVEDDYYDEVIKPELDKMYWTEKRAEFMVKCLYPGEKPLSKKDYGRTMFTIEKIWDKRTTLMQVEKKSQHEARSRGMRHMQICKGIYPFGLTFEQALENPEIKRYYEKGLYKRGSFVDKWIAHIHRF